MPCRRNGQGGSAPARLTMPQGGAFFMEEETMADAFRDRMMAATRVVRSEETALKRRIAALYASCARDMGKEVAHYGADSLTGRRAQALQKSMRAYVKALWQDVRVLAEDAIRKGAKIGIETQSGMLGDALHGVGITTRQSFAGMFARTQDEAVASVLNGSIYAGKRAGLSRRIWKNEALLGGQIEQLIASAVAQGRSATQLARDLEAFVKPDAMMPDNWNDIYEGLPFAFRVDYNAKRLAVSALNHSYFQGVILAGRENPYAEFLHWELSRSHEIYDVCDTYMEHDEGLGKGNFALDNAPLPHPFCKCTWYIDCNKSLEEIGEELGEWLAGAENPKLERAFGKWKQQEVSLDANASIGYNETEPANTFGRKLDRPFSSGKMLPGDHFTYGGKNVIFEGWRDKPETIAGKGCKRKIDIIDYLVAECGGRPGDWKKRKCWAYVLVDDVEREVDIHWFENSVINKFYGGKIKYDAETGEWDYPLSSEMYQE